MEKITITVDKVIIGSGIYGLYAANFCAKSGEKVVVLERDSVPCSRATYINQARVHMGYHYPRSLATALKSAHYYERFDKDYKYCINSSFDQIYATSKTYSWTSAEQFEDFARRANIRCDKQNVDNYFRPNMCDGAFLTTETTYDAKILADHMINELNEYDNVSVRYSSEVVEIKKDGDSYFIKTIDNTVYQTPFVLNATYASINQINALAGFEPINIKYELCEIILCKVNDKLKNKGITVMDGPFFSIMPFGNTDYHSLTSVTFTPHKSCYDKLPNFACQKDNNVNCTEKALGNCNDCKAKPESAWPYMSSLAKKYLKDEYQFEYYKSLFSMKPILQASEIDDSRPTVIKVESSNPTFISVLSGKVNTVYDLDEFLIKGDI